VLSFWAVVVTVAKISSKRPQTIVFIDLTSEIVVQNLARVDDRIVIARANVNDDEFKPELLAVRPIGRSVVSPVLIAEVDITPRSQMTTY